jgi:multiple sugar transport system permease protein
VRLRSLRGTDLPFAVILLLPVFLFIGIFAFYPAFYAVYLSFYQSDFLIMNKHFVGLGNYVEILKNSEFWSSFWKTAVFTFVSIAGQFFIGIILALVLNHKIRITTWLRIIITIPWTLSPIVIAVIFQTLYVPDQTGLLNYYLMSLGIISQPVAWLGPNMAMWMVIVANIWFGMPFSFIMQLAGLQSIPVDVYEASRVEGASRMQQFFKITLPLLKPTILINVVWISISTLNEFDLVYALTNGGPLKATNLLGIDMYNTAFKMGQFEQGSTIAVLMFVINVILSFIYVKMMKTEKYN